MQRIKKRIPGEAKNTSEPKEITIFALLDRLIELKEKDLYYYLMNDVKILNLSKESIDLASVGSNKSYNTRLEKIFSYLVGDQAKVRILDSQDKDTHLKKDIIQEFKNSSAWKIIEEKLPGSKIVDVVHRDW